MFAPVADSIYDPKSKPSGRDWLEVRAPSVAVLLKSERAHLTTLESAILRYSQYAASQPDGADNLYVVVDRNGAGYLAADTLLWSAGMTSRPVEKWKNVSPVLVFSRHAVFSMLTGRDDRAQAPSLATLLERLGRPAKVELGSDGTRLVEGLRQVSALTDSTSRRLATIVASGLVDMSQPRVDSAWSELSQNERETQPCGSLLIEEAYFWANRLSAETAKLAAKFEDRDLAAALDSVQSAYLERAGRRLSSNDDSADGAREAWGCLWSYDLLQTVIDDNIRTRAGSSSSQASAMSAALDLAGIEHFQLAIRKGDLEIPDQEWLIVGGDKYQYNFGIWTRLPDALPAGKRAPNVLISGLTLRGLPVRIMPGQICSRLDYLTVAERFTRATRQLPLAVVSIATPSGEVLPAQKFLLDLADERFEFKPTAWPDHQSN
jgi:hypothetical protein